MIDILIFVYRVLSEAINIYSILIVVYALLSWLPGAYNSKLEEILARLCEPYLDVFRRIIPPIGGISFSPIVALIVLSLVNRGLYYVLMFLIQTIAS
ncbi:YggT family protein [Carnobacterium divergens]|uniref:YggT family protein n=1 Tax=Carnobacterium divergens TaxID=2748 RepID=UPI0010717A0D|nr:YggT family protein [Carnobacterium divergens]TFJ38887.1 YggT family protein [Carnobacterium divergens]TFJ48122.1 YggT family protein [Carnobacterium divergens]TFJ53086.1 YggT family protein [Carnobacterium divergens]TFJ57173.1 YggT family protein [Carnobacterium divergens]TFJ68876.1 YggT family protein [Carnobacterium divergens]